MHIMFNLYSPDFLVVMILLCSGVITLYHLTCVQIPEERECVREMRPHWQNVHRLKCGASTQRMSLCEQTMNSQFAMDLHKCV